MEGTRGARVSTTVQKLTRIEYLEAEEGGGRDEGSESLHSLRHALRRHGRLIDLTLNLSRVENGIEHDKRIWRGNLEKTDNGMKALVARVGKLEKLVTRVEKLEKPWFSLGANATAGAETAHMIGVLLGDLEKLGGAGGAGGAERECF